MPDASSTTKATQLRWPAPPAFHCTLQTRVSGAAWVHAVGELDLATSPQLSRMLGEALLNARLAVLDMRDITFIDSAGVHVLLDAASDAARNGCRLMLVRGPARVDDVLRLTGASERLLTFDLDPNEPAEMLPLAPMHLDPMHVVE
jgi:anti-sigma B factor antagonist